MGSRYTGAFPCPLRRLVRCCFFPFCFPGEGEQSNHGQGRASQYEAYLYPGAQEGRTDGWGELGERWTLLIVMTVLGLCWMRQNGTCAGDEGIAAAEGKIHGKGA
ncbi:hypothetical protein C8A01DRAFT_17911 [Parachaetomium inaequale]|uniref:Uncharacterized protein n=1 Tax=Parachaetomium inaequale TaxID=2588326 RepID=A0AAN6PBK0_9PEZI|nr:hypothetical protein C8A01DRAFT_17911 [Parachaetomium inaequale]